jgi:hypothetical protein
MKSTIRAFLPFLLAALVWSGGAQAQVSMTHAGRGAPGGGASFSITYEASATSNTTTATQNLGTVSYGATPSVVVIPICYSSATPVTISSVSLNGVSGSQVSGFYDFVAGVGQNGDAWYVVAPGGSSGNLTITFSGALSSAGAALYVSLYNIQTSTTTPSVANAAQSNNASSLSASVAIPTGGGAIASYCSWIGETFSGWTNAVNDFNGTTGNMAINVGHNTTAGGTTPTITGTTGSANAATLGVVSWHP